MKWPSGNSTREIRKLFESLQFGRTDLLLLVLAGGSMYALANDAEPWGVALIVLIFLMVLAVQKLWGEYARKRAARRRLNLSTAVHRSTIERDIERAAESEQELPLEEREKPTRSRDEEGTDGV